MSEIVQKLYNLFYSFNKFVKLEKPFTHRYIIYVQNAFYNYTITIQPEHFTLSIDNRITGLLQSKIVFKHNEMERLVRLLNKHIESTI